MMRRTDIVYMVGRVTLAGGLLAIARVADAQQGTGAGLGPAAQESVRALADSLRSEKLPGDALTAKAAEGTLKGASEARILTAVRTLARELRDARGILGERATSGELVAAATALHAGVSGDALRQLRGALPPDGRRGGLAVPLVVVADLVSRGASVRAAAGSVRALVAQRASDDALQAVRASVERDVLAGAEPDVALLARSHAMAETLPAPPGVRRDSALERGRRPGPATPRSPGAPR